MMFRRRQPRIAVHVHNESAGSHDVIHLNVHDGRIHLTVHPDHTLTLADHAPGAFGL